MDFFKIREKIPKKGSLVVYPDFAVIKTSDLMVKGNAFYAIWDEEKGLWSTDEYDVVRLVDKDLYQYKNNKTCDSYIDVKYMSEFSSGSWELFKRYISKQPDDSKDLDSKITFSNTSVKKSDYISKRLSYPLEEGNIENYEKLISTLYTPEERKKIEWAIGSIIKGDSKSIQKFLVFYGDAGAGKSTILNIIQKLFEGYYISFDAKSLTSNTNSFATSVFSSNPLVAIQHDGDLSNIKDNTTLNSIVSHEDIIVNEKFKKAYTIRSKCFLFMATNKPVKITDAKSGLIRRLIDVRPSGQKLSPKEYNQIMDSIDFELGGIAYYCLQQYESMGKHYYDTYKPVDMMYRTDPFFNFVENYFFHFRELNAISLKAAYALYKEYCQEAAVEYKLQMYKFRDELKNYFAEFYDVCRVDGNYIRSYYSGFLYHKFDRFNEKEVQETLEVDEEVSNEIIFGDFESILDKKYGDAKAQYAKEDETPSKTWAKVKTTLKDLNTKELHYVQLPEPNHIVIDFDLKDENGNKSFEKNLKEASKWPKTYAELSKSGAGIHLHYIYTGDVERLSRIYDENIEVKVFTGDSSLRRKLTKCNEEKIARISSGLPLKAKGNKMVNFDGIKNEKSLRTLILKNLNKEIHPNTKPSMDFIKKILDDAYESGMQYDITNLKQNIYAFAAASSHQSEYCLKLFKQLKFKSGDEFKQETYNEDADIAFYDIEVFPNLLLVCYKLQGEGKPIIRLFNPSPEEIENLLKLKLVGFNCRRYDNHILYARMMGYDNKAVYKLSQSIISGDTRSFFGPAYNASYADIYDFASTKQSLKKWEIQLGIHHQELGMDWNKPVPEDKWEEVASYCDNDVVATEAVWNFDQIQEDLVARKILAALSGLSINDTTRTHVTKIMFGDEKHPELQYTDLSETFPGYEYVNGKNMYRDVDLGSGGYVYAEPGMYIDVALLDITSLHPHSAVELNYFGEQTAKFKEIMDARVFIKRKDFDSAKKLLNGVLKPFLTDTSKAAALAQALKIIINSVYGYTCATFDNAFRDPRNVNNIIALRGALFMKTLQDEVAARGFKVAHIKTDSIKIPNATPEIISFCMDFAKKYGYNFEHEATYEKMCLVNNAVYVARYQSEKWCQKEYGYVPGDNKKHQKEWTATGTQFKVPYVFKTLFSKEPIIFEDMCETKSVSTAMYLDMNEGHDDWHSYHFIGKVGLFCPIKEGKGGGLLVRNKSTSNELYDSVTGTKGYRWLEAEMVRKMKKEKDIDKSYYNNLVDEAIETIAKYGDAEMFISDDSTIMVNEVA